MGWDIDENQLQKMSGVRNVQDSREGCQTSSGDPLDKQGDLPDKPRPRQPKQRANQTEKRYEQDFLWPAYQRGEIWDYRFEPLKLRLADNTFYTPDFLVVKVTGLEIHEIKGSYEREDARVKWKTAAELFPWFQFVVARWLGKKKGWKVEKY